MQGFCCCLLCLVFTHLHIYEYVTDGCLSTLNMCVCFAAKFDVSVMEQNCFHISSTSAAADHFFSALLNRHAVCVCVWLNSAYVSAEPLRFACGLMMRCMCGRHSYSASKDVAFDWHIDWTSAFAIRNFAHYLECIDFSSTSLLPVRRYKWYQKHQFPNCQINTKSLSSFVNVFLQTIWNIILQRVAFE
jgi:hypothetical protein